MGCLTGVVLRCLRDCDPSLSSPLQSCPRASLDRVSHGGADQGVLAGQTQAVRKVKAVVDVSRAVRECQQFHKQKWRAQWFLCRTCVFRSPRGPTPVCKLF